MERVMPNASRYRGQRRRPQFRDEPQNVGEQVSRDRDLRCLKGDIAAVADDLRGSQRCQEASRPPDRLRNCRKADFAHCKFCLSRYGPFDAFRSNPRSAVVNPLLNVVVASNAEQ